METNINILFLITVPIITIILYLISENLLITAIIGGILLVLSIAYVVRNKSRKEMLNIIQSGKTLYFNLSDDQLFSIELEHEDRLRELLFDVIRKEEATIKDMVYYINFVNFKNDALQKELIELIQAHV